MQCAEFEVRLHHSLDSRLDPESDSQLVEHAHACETCRQILNVQSRLFEGLRLPIEQPESTFFGHAVLDQVTAHRQRRTKRRRIATALAVAAAIAVIVLPLARAPRPGTAKKSKSPAGLAIATVPAPAPRPSLSPGEAEELRLLMRRLLDVSSRPLETLESVDHVASKSIRPLAVTFNFAFDTLWRTLPGQGGSGRAEPQAGFQLRDDFDWLG